MPAEITLKDIHDIGQEIANDWKGDLTYFFGLEEEKNSGGEASYPIFNIQFPVSRDLRYINGSHDRRWDLVFELVNNTQTDITKAEYAEMLEVISDQLRALVQRFITHYQDRGSINGKEIRFDVVSDVVYTPIIKATQETVIESGLRAAFSIRDEAHYGKCDIQDYFN